MAPRSVTAAVRPTPPGATQWCDKPGSQMQPPRRARAIHTRPADAGPSKTASAEIVAKPTPVYTDEARKLHIEGEVLLEVVLESGGRVRVVRLVRGLGHGLDEAAVRAAEQIRFKPALRDGQPVDSGAVLHIVFQLA